MFKYRNLADCFQLKKEKLAQNRKKKDWRYISTLTMNTQIAVVLQDAVAVEKLEQTISMIWASMALLTSTSEIFCSWQVMVSL